MLLREDGSGGKKRDLLIVQHCLKRRPQRNFCLAETDIATDEPVHWFRIFHIIENFFDCLELALSFFKFKTRFHLPEKLVFRGVIVSFNQLTLSMNFNKFLGDIFDLFFDLLFCINP